jgi:biopolymer transport protein ExbB
MSANNQTGRRLHRQDHVLRAGLIPKKSGVIRPVVLTLALSFILVAGLNAIVGAQDPTPPGPVSADTEIPTRTSAIPSNPTEVVKALGFAFVVPFLVASVIAVWFASERMVTLRRRRVIPKAFVDRFLAHLRAGRLQPAQAMEICEKNGSPVAQVFAHGVRKWGKPSVEVEQAIIDGGERQISFLRKHLRILNGVATVTPLIGLLGTVLGMIQAFNQIANTDAMGKAQELAVGIALALLTTAAGLLIAIPALIAYMYLTGKVDSLVIEMDQLAQEVVHMISAEAIHSKASHPSAVGQKPGRQESAGKGREPRAV